MTERPHRAGRGAGRSAVRGTASVGLVLALAGLMFTANARLASSQEARHPQDLGELADRESSRVEMLAARVDGLRAEVESLTDEQIETIETGDADAAELVAIAAGRAAVTGPGLTVQLTDAPAGRVRHPDATPDDLVVHQQDLQGVINALWAGGAEAMALEDQRVTALTAFRCVGNVLSLGGRVYSPPYEVHAVGDPRALREALMAAESVQTYLGYVARDGLGWSVTEEESLALPAAELGGGLTHARVPDGVDVFPTGARGRGDLAAAGAGDAGAGR
ncbi:DUF881 domain-containing protein [Cellulomonas sp. ATA003]|uniref:DUF881 domain-containing protein n=1 Tax=Cellulomonas sp. ATA003 TaxID=3073064 RepID=UPI0028736205|nr:DUF881 domain-containing protein [Cellulomonas sp. ATA003]WNB85577.1 DUF881 domain-containing protein [Cellulomonas sp. ATA003]